MSAGAAVSPRGPGGSRPGDDGRPGSHRLEAAGVAAGAAGSGWVDHDVADLAREPERSAVERTVEDDARGDAGPDGEQRDAVDGSEQAAPMEAQRRRSDVVLDRGGDPESG